MALFVFTKAMLSGDTFDLFNHGDMQRDYTYVDDTRTRKVPIQPGEVVSTWANCTALREEIGFEACSPIREGVKHFVAWYRRYYDI